MVSSFWAMDRVFSVQMDRTWVWPLMNRPEPWTRGRTPTSAASGRIIHAAAIDALASQQPLFDDLLLHLIQADLDVVLKVLIFFRKMVRKIDAGRRQALFADVLVRRIQRVFDLVHAIGAQIVQQGMVDRCFFKCELRLTDASDDGIDKFNDLDVRLVCQLNALEQDILGDLPWLPSRS